MNTPTDRGGPASMWDLFSRVVSHDTAPAPGQHRVASDDPRLRAFMDGIAVPELEACGARVSTDRAGNVLATFGERTGDEVLLVAYPATHHGNEMPDRLQARVVTTDGTTYWVGQGASEGKAGFVSLIGALRAAVERDVRLGGRVLVAISSEGSSTNTSSSTMFDEMGTLPTAAVLVIGTQNKIALGHRGRADVIVTTRGAARHSSVAAKLPNAIDAICDAQRRVLRYARHWAEAPGTEPGRSVTPYRLMCGPVAPHTMPERCELALDCRFLVGDDIEKLREGLATAIASPDVEVALGPVMLPAATEPTARIVTALVDAGRHLGVDLETFTPPWTFDAGAASTRGLPAVLFGPSSDNLAAITAADGVSVDMLTQATAILASVIESWTSR